MLELLVGIAHQFEQLVDPVAKVVHLIVGGGVRHLQLHLQHGELLAVIVSLLLERFDSRHQRGGFLVLLGEHRGVPRELRREGRGRLLLAGEDCFDALLELVGFSHEVGAEAIHHRGHAPLRQRSSRGRIRLGSLELSLLGGECSLRDLEFLGDGVGIRRVGGAPGRDGPGRLEGGEPRPQSLDFSLRDFAVGPEGVDLAQAVLDLLLLHLKGSLHHLRAHGFFLGSLLELLNALLERANVRELRRGILCGALSLRVPLIEGVHRDQNLLILKLDHLLHLVHLARGRRVQRRALGLDRGELRLEFSHAAACRVELLQALYPLGERLFGFRPERLLRRELSLCRPERVLELIDPAGVDGHVAVVVAGESGLELLDPDEQSLLGRDGLVGNLLDELKRRSHLLQLGPRQRELSRELGGVGLLALGLLHGRGSRDGDSQLLALLLERVDPAREGELARFGRGDGGRGGGFRVAELDV